MNDFDVTTPAVKVDEELSAAIIAYHWRDRSPFPKADPDAVTAIARTRRPDELVTIILAIKLEMRRIPVDWSTMGLTEGSDIASTGIAARHPELSSEAVTTLRWDFSYGMR